MAQGPNNDSISHADIVGHLMSIKDDITKVQTSLATVAANTNVTTDIVEDHEKRVKSLEKWRYVLVGAAIVVGFFFPRLGETLAQTFAEGPHHAVTPIQPPH